MNYYNHFRVGIVVWKPPREAYTYEKAAEFYDVQYTIGKMSGISTVTVATI